MKLVARDYPWLTSDDGRLSADLSECTPAEADRRLIICQEYHAGRIDLGAGWKLSAADPVHKDS